MQYSYLPPPLAHSPEAETRVIDNDNKALLADVITELKISNKYEAEKADEVFTEEDLK